MMLAIGLASAPIWDAIRLGYPNDSYWTLNMNGRLGVFAISSVGILVIFLALAAKTRIILRRKQQATNTAWVLIDIALGLLCFGVVYSVSPQVFYTFYLLIFTDLPNQWVIDTPLNVERLTKIAVFKPNGSLADHLAGVALWAIVPFTGWLHLRHWWRGGD